MGNVLLDFYRNRGYRLTDELILHILNNDYPSEVTDNPGFLHRFGDYIKVDGIVYSTESIMRDKRKHD